MNALRQLGSAVLALETTDLALRLTLLTLMLRPIGEPQLRPWVLLLAAAGLLAPALARRPALWGLLAGLTAWRVLADWPLADNHAYLLSYWCLAIAISLAALEPPAALARNARWLIGLAFGFAVVWKGLLSVDYLDGTFFRVTFLTDPRLESFSTLAGGLSLEQLTEAREVLWQHLDGAAAGGHEMPALPLRFEWLARFATLWTLGSEALVAVSFLLPDRRGLAALRDPVLLMFCATAYALLPTIAGFGWLLLAMGVAQCDPERHRVRLTYLGAFALLLVYRELV